MIEPDDIDTDQEFEGKLRTFFQVQDADQLFIDRLGKKLESRFKVVGRLAGGQENLPVHPRLLRKMNLLLSPLAWGTMGLILLLALIWGIKTLIPGGGPITGSKLTPSPVITKTMPVDLVHLSAGDKATLNTPTASLSNSMWFPDEAITSGNVHKIAQLRYFGKGIVKSYTWLQDGKTFVIATSSGIYIYNAETFHHIRTIEPGLNVQNLTLSPDGKIMAFSSSMGIHLYDTETYEEIIMFTQGTNTLNLIFSPDGTIIAADLDSEVKFWDIQSGKELLTIAGNRIWGFGMAFSPDGLLFALSSAGSTIKLVQIPSGRVVQEFTSPNVDELIEDVKFSLDGSRLVSISVPVTRSSHGSLISTGPGIVRLWDISTGEQLNSQTECSGNDFALSPDGITIALRGEETIIFCDIKSGSMVNKLDATLDYHIRYSPNGSFFAGIVNGEVRVWDAAQLEEVSISIRGDDAVYRFIFSPDGKRLASASADSVTIWDTNSGQVQHIFTGQNDIKNSEILGQSEGYGDPGIRIAFSPDGQILATVSQEGPVKLYKVYTGELLAKLETNFSSTNYIIFSPDGNLLAISGWRNEPLFIGVQIWDVALRKQRMQLDDFKHIVYSLAFSPDGITLATGEGNGDGIPGSAKIWDIKTGKLLNEFGIHTNDLQNYWTIYDIVFNPDGTLLAAASGKGVLIWNVAKEEQQTILTANTYVMKVVFSPDGNLLASGGLNDEEVASSTGSELRLWDIATGEVLFISEGLGMIYGIAFSPDGRVLASASMSGDVWFWDVKTGKALGTLDLLWSHHTAYSETIAFSPDGRLLATGGDMVRLWGIPPMHPAPDPD